MCSLPLSFHSQALIKAAFEALGELEMSARLLVTQPQPTSANSNAYEQLHRVEGATVTGLVPESTGCWMEGLEDTTAERAPTPTAFPLVPVSQRWVLPHLSALQCFCYRSRHCRSGLGLQSFLSQE